MLIGRKIFFLLLLELVFILLTVKNTFFSYFSHCELKYISELEHL